MKSLCIVVAMTCFLASYCVADDQSHPYSVSVHSVHSSLAAGSPKWFHPGYGYVLPDSPIPQRTLVPYLSQRADTPFDPYVFRPLIFSEQTSPAFRRAGRVWPVPGDVPGFRIDALRNYGQLPSGAGLLW